MNELKRWFSENNFPPKYGHSKSFVFEVCWNEKFSIQNLTFWKIFVSNFLRAGKRLLQILILFFGKIQFKFWFSMKKFGKKSCLLKWAKKPKSVLFSAEQTESKQFFRCEFFIEIWFLKKNCTQKLTSSKTFFLQKMIIRKVLFSKNFRNELTQFKIWLVEKFSIQNLIF